MNKHRDASFVTSYLQGVPLLTPSGHLDVSNAATFECMLEKTAKPTNLTDAMIVDFEHCAYFDSVAVGVIVKFLRLTVKRRVVLVATPQSALAKVLEMVGLRRMCAIVPSLDEALCTIHAVAA